MELDAAGWVFQQLRTFDGRIQLLEYAPTVLAGPPGTSRASA
jgi:hypothetical protein